jgi:hypothetical protein
MRIFLELHLGAVAEFFNSSILQFEPSVLAAIATTTTDGSDGRIQELKNHYGTANCLT